MDKGQFGEEGNMDYLRWSKVHPLVRYELTDSGVPAAQRTHFDPHRSPVSLENQGAYGHPQLIEAIARRYRVPSANVVPVPGASSANFIALAVAADRGACVILEHPCYQPLQRVAEFLRLRVIPLVRDPERCFEVSADDVELGLDQGATAVVLTNLHNPSGQLLSIDAIKDISHRCSRAGATLIVDEVYLDAACLIGDQPCWTAANVAENVIAINSLTKVYGLSGLRIGWLLTGAKLADRARQLMDLLSVHNAAPSTSLALSAFGNITVLEDRFRRLYEEGQPVYRRWLADDPRVQGYPSYGAIFECVRLPEGVSSDRLHELLVSKYDTQVTPGRFFDLDDHIRLTIALPEDDLTEALARISRAITQLLEQSP